MKLAGWIGQFIGRRRRKARAGTWSTAVLAARIEGRPITLAEAIGTIQLLILGGLETNGRRARRPRCCGSASTRGSWRRSARARSWIPAAVEELLRLDGSFICIGRTARHDAQIDGNTVNGRGAGSSSYWPRPTGMRPSSTSPTRFSLDRERNRHVAFGAGPHRCVGSNLARMNLRVALDVIARRLAT